MYWCSITRIVVFFWPFATQGLKLIAMPQQSCCVTIGFNPWVAFHESLDGLTTDRRCWGEWLKRFRVARLWITLTSCPVASQTVLSEIKVDLMSKFRITRTVSVQVLWTLWLENEIALTQASRSIQPLAFISTTSGRTLQTLRSCCREALCQTAEHRFEPKELRGLCAHR